MNVSHGLIADRVKRVSKPAKAFQAIRFSGIPHGNKRYIIGSPRIEEIMLLHLNRAIKGYLPDSMALNPNEMSVIQ